MREHPNAAASASAQQEEDDEEEEEQGNKQPAEEEAQEREVADEDQNSEPSSEEGGNWGLITKQPTGSNLLVVSIVYNIDSVYHILIIVNNHSWKHAKCLSGYSSSSDLLGIGFREVERLIICVWLERCSRGGGYSYMTMTTAC